MFGESPSPTAPFSSQVRVGWKYTLCEPTHVKVTVSPTLAVRVSYGVDGTDQLFMTICLAEADDTRRRRRVVNMANLFREVTINDLISISTTYHNLSTINLNLSISIPVLLLYCTGIYLYQYQVFLF